MMIELDTIYNEDCLETMKRIPGNSVDLIITSPPYNNFRNKRTQKNREKYWKRTVIKYDNFNDEMSEDVYQDWQINVINECLRILRPGGTLCYNHKDRIYEFSVISPLVWILKSNALLRQTIIWDRMGMQACNPVRFYRFEEFIYILGKEKIKYKFNSEFAKYNSIWRILPSKNIYEHNATFPEEIPKRLIESLSNENDIVYDPFCGIGTTAIAAKKLNRRFIGSEISPKYCEIANELLSHTIENDEGDYF